MDIEDIVGFGRSNGFCPFYFAKTIAKSADLILVTSSHILSPKEKKSLKEVLQNSVVIFDGAEKLESQAEENASFVLPLETLFKAVEELSKIKALFENKGEKIPAGSNIAHGEVEGIFKDILVTEGPLKELQENFNFMMKYHRGISKKKKEEEESEGPPDPEAHLIRNAKSFNELSRFIYAYSVPEKDPSKEKDFDPLMLGISEENAQKYAARMRKVTTFVRGVKGDMVPENIEVFLSFIDYFGKIASKSQAKKAPSWDEDDRNHYKVSIEIDERGSGQLSIHLWCLLPSIGFRGVSACKARSMIFASNSIDPTDGFQNQMGVTCNELTRCPHVIDGKDQILAGFVRKYRINSGPINFSGKGRNNPRMYYDLGRIAGTLPFVLTL